MTKEELITICDIADRAWPKVQETSYKGVKKLTLFMDIKNVHERRPLDLKQLLAFEDGDFYHDINGIAANINRKTGELENGFSPRCSKH